jgi:hypothetical protein
MKSRLTPVFSRAGGFFTIQPVVAGCHFPAWNPMEQHTIKPHEIKVCFVLRGIPCHALVLHKGKK